MREKQAEQLIREEKGGIYNPKIGTRVVLVFPNSYYLGMSSLGFQVILNEINDHPLASCERGFYEEYNSQSLPVSFETQKPISSFDIVGFSVAFEMDYINVVSIIHNSGMPLTSEKRGKHDPLIIAGGICVTFNPEPIAPFIDAIVIGDGEVISREIVTRYRLWQKTKRDRKELLLELSRIDGVYVPSLYDVEYNKDGTISSVTSSAGVKSVVKRFNSGDLDNINTASKIITPNTEFSSCFLVEVVRGCANRCKFCIASYSQKCRIRSTKEVLNLTKGELAHQADKIGLVGSSVVDHPDIDRITESLLNAGHKISVASVRADSVSEKFLDALVASNQRTITLAPEAATDKLRKAIGKNMSIEVVYDTIELAVRKGISNIKLYFMVGLPGEEEDDVLGIISVSNNARNLLLDYARDKNIIPPNLVISISPFVPKPHTPFQWCKMEDAKILSKKLKFLRKELMRVGGIKVPSSSARLSAIQGVLSRGDRKLAKVLTEMAERSLSWQQAIKSNGLSPDFYLEKNKEIFPWDHIDLGISRENLKKLRPGIYS
ncbi:radical SAM protein [Candidatus Poribacteria bacterium]|nr:radical SAM protein [Candidatus Poribacteria bacterium]